MENIIIINGKINPIQPKNTSVQKQKKLKDSTTQKLQAKTISKTQISKYYK